MILALSLFGLVAVFALSCFLLAVGEVKQIDSSRLLLAKRQQLRRAPPARLRCTRCSSEAFHTGGFLDYCDPCWQRVSRDDRGIRA